MEISVSSSTVTIIGNVKSISDFQAIKSNVDAMKDSHKDITIFLKDSISLTSSVIGYFNKLILKDKITIHMNIGDKQLMDLLDDLSLSSIFKAKKV